MNIAQYMYIKYVCHVVLACIALITGVYIVSNT